MSDKIPTNKPQATVEDLFKFIPINLTSKITDEVYLIGVRGYYKKTFGHTEKNDRIFYDDALFIVQNNTVLKSFNFNTDPSIQYKVGLATLKAGEIYSAVKWRHKGKYPALQITRDIVSRDGKRGWDIGRHGINFHWDSDFYSKFSLGCQTIPKSQWLDFQKTIYKLMDTHNLNFIKYILVENA